MSKLLETSNNYSKPFRPLPIKLFNAVGSALQPFGFFGDLNALALMDAAKKKTGLSDFGEGFSQGRGEENGKDEIFYKAFIVLIDAINQEAKLTPFGKLIQKTRFISALCTRLSIADLLKKHPEINQINLGKVIVIAGLQRTGTTTLHRLIAADPNIRSLVSWEALNPLPLEGEQKGKPEKRIKLAQQAEKALAYMAPEFFAIHPVEHDAPEEDILLLDLCFMSQAPEATFYVPTYAKWLEQQNHQQAYQYLKTVLKILQWYQPKQNWVLKTPHHMEYIDQILKVFPEATIVQTHRDPQKTTGSFCSMVAHGRGVFSDEVDAKEVAQHWTDKVERMMRLSIASREKELREKGNKNSFVDVSYYDLLKNPLAEIEKIYSTAGLVLEEKAKQAMANTKEKNTQHRFGKHVYDIADFGLSVESIEEKYRFYREHYKIPKE
jgi:Sulfotransferase family